MWNRQRGEGAAEWQEASKRNQTTPWFSGVKRHLKREAPCYASWHRAPATAAVAPAQTDSGLGPFSPQQPQPTGEEGRAGGAIRATEETRDRHVVYPKVSNIREGNYFLQFLQTSSDMSSHQQAMRPELLSHWWVQSAKLASQPVKLGPGHEQQINTAWHVRCTMACKIPKHLSFSPLGSICANYIDGNSWPRTKLNQTDLREGCRGLGKMVIHLQCRMGRMMLCH